MYSNRLFFLVLFMLYTISYVVGQVNPQQKLIDSLQQTLVNAKLNDTNKIKTWSKLSNVYRNIRDTAQARKYIDLGLALSKKLDYKFGILTMLTEEANLYMDNQNYTIAKEKFNTIIKKIEQDTDFVSLKARIVAKGNLATIYGLENDPERELSELILIITDAEKLNDKRILGTIYNNIGSKLSNANNKNKSIYYFNRASDYYTENNNIERLPGVYMGLADAYYSLDSIAQLKNILDIWQQCLKAQNVDLAFNGAYYMFNASYYYKIKNVDEAINNYKLAIVTSKAYNNHITLLDSYAALANLYKDEGNNELAINTFKELLPLADKYNNDLTHLIALKGLANCYKKNGNNKESLFYLENYVKFKDSVSKKDVDFRVNNLDARYQAQKKENEILLLTQEKKDSVIKLQQNKWIIGALLGGMLLTALVLYYYVNAQKRKVALVKQQELLMKNQLRELEQQKQIDAAKAMVEGQEQERERVAQDLHDGLGGLIAGTKLYLSNIATKNDNIIIQEPLQFAIERIDNTLQELRRVARNLMPQTLLRYGLKSALQDLCNSEQINDVNITFQQSGLQTTMNQSTQISIYRIIQELLTNALKHAKAKQILVQLVQDNQQLYITVEDDGIGINVNQPEATSGIGLINIKNRITLLNGSLDVQTAPNIGTTINIELMVA